MPSARGLPALAGLEIDQHPAGDQVRIGVEVGAAVERHPGVHGPGRQCGQQSLARQVPHRDQVGDLGVVGQIEQVRGAAVLVEARINREPSTAAARYSSTISARA